jgi:hypothetical protein
VSQPFDAPSHLLQTLCQCKPIRLARLASASWRAAWKVEKIEGTVRSGMASALAAFT